MINKVYVSTADASLVQSVQTVAIASLGYLWAMGPVEEMRMVKSISSSKWAWMVLQGGSITTTNTGPNPYSRTAKVATSLSDVTTAFAPTTPLVSPPAQAAFVLSFTSFINSFTKSIASATAPMTAAFTLTHTYNSDGVVSGFLHLGDGSTSVPYTSSMVVDHTYATGSWTASLALSESSHTSTSVALVYVTTNVPRITASFSIYIAGGTPSGSTAPFTTSFTDDSTTNIGTGATTTYKLVYGDGTTSSNSALPDHGYGTGSFPVELQITESIYGITSKYVLPRGITGSLPILMPSFTVLTSSGIAPFTAAFTNTSDFTGEGYSERWVFGDGTTSAQTNPPNHTYQTGSFPVRLEMTESVYHLTASYVLPYGITGSVPTVVASFTTNSVGFGGAPESYMEPVTISFTSSVSSDSHGGLTYLWDFGNLQSSSLVPPPQGNYTTGAYTASLTVTEDSYGISSTSAQSFIVST